MQIEGKLRIVFLHNGDYVSSSVLDFDEMDPVVSPPGTFDGVAFETLETAYPSEPWINFDPIEPADWHVVEECLDCLLFWLRRGVDVEAAVYAVIGSVDPDGRNFEDEDALDTAEMHIRLLRRAAKAVIDCWEHGDLAEAVRNLQSEYEMTDHYGLPKEH